MSALRPIIYLARHTETGCSIFGQYAGLADPPLTGQGERNARRLGEQLSKLTFARVFTSPLERAGRTCEPAGFATAESNPNHVEWKHGDYKGGCIAEILKARTDGQIFPDGCPGGESPVQVGARADRVVKRVRPIKLWNDTRHVGD